MGSIIDPNLRRYENQCLGLVFLPRTISALRFLVRGGTKG